MRLTPYVLVLVALSVGCARGPSLEPSPSADEFDVIIENGRVVDGTGNAWFYGDIGVRGHRVATIVPKGVLRDATATERIDATGLVVAPGFIDIQSHSRGSPPLW